MKFGIVGLLMASASATAQADEKTRFQSSGFLQSLDLFISEQMSKLRSDHQTPKGKTTEDLGLSLRDTSDARDSGFLYLRDRTAPAQTKTEHTLTARPDFSSLLAPSGTVRGTYGQDIFGANSRLGVSFGSPKAKAEGKGLEIALESAYRLSMQGIPATTGFGDNNFDLAEREYNLGVSVGYSGFGFDASIMRQTNLFKGDLSGYGVGFSYRSTSWAARLSLNEYKSGADLYGIENDARNFMAVELGASYRLTDRVGFLGGVRYYDYGNRLMLDPTTGDRSQMIFLGGRLKF
ncbi:porin [Kordiimonas marina]|uniref:porin n=1 Tax=Kordiimonas marina TaxID=2872312 RepID=UPI001FF297D8|nr:porin [Kordiimonas marina]MCJ9429831.1 porin [Kordiimonas marina]